MLKTVLFVFERAGINKWCIQNKHSFCIYVYIYYILRLSLLYYYFTKEVSSELFK